MLNIIKDILLQIKIRLQLFGRELGLLFNLNNATRNDNISDPVNIGDMFKKYFVNLGPSIGKNT